MLDQVLLRLASKLSIEKLEGNDECLFLLLLCANGIENSKEAPRRGRSSPRLLKALVKSASLKKPIGPLISRLGFKTIAFLLLLILNFRSSSITQEFLKAASLLC